MSTGIVFGGAILLGGVLLIIAAVRASTYAGTGDSGVYGPLFWGFPTLAVGLVALFLLIAIRAGIRQFRA